VVTPQFSAESGPALKYSVCCWNSENLWWKGIHFYKTTERISHWKPYCQKGHGCLRSQSGWILLRFAFFTF